MTLLAGAIAAACSFDASGTTLREAAGAAPGYSFYSTGGDYRYFWRCDGENGAKSGGYHIGNVNSWMDVVVQGPATVTFEWRASSESTSWDWLAFHDNGSEKERIGGSDTGWRTKTYEISDSNAHLLQFLYRKDGSVDSGSDCGWVRNFQVTRSADLLPADYIQYAYLHTDGGAAIDSGYSYAANTRIDVDWNLDASSSLTGLAVPSGASTLTCQGATAYCCDGGTDSSKAISIGGTASGNSCPLFLLDQAGGMTPGEGDKIAGDIYSFRIIDTNGAVQRNMIPCMRFSDSVAGFYDTIGGGFYPSVSGTPFTAVSRVGGYIVTLDAQGGEGGTTSVKAMFGAEMPAIECPTKSGSDFLGYFDEETGAQYYDLVGYGVRTWDQDADKTLTARWDSENVSLFLTEADVGTSYVVSNRTADAEVALFCVTADGRSVYRLPAGVQAEVYCAPSAGCSIERTNPYVISSVAAGMTVDAANLPRGVTPVQLALEAVFDTANSATTVEQVRDGDDVLLGHRVTLGKNYNVLTLGEDLGAVTIDLNGWKISGSNGANGSDSAAGANGVAAITVSGTSCAAGATQLTIANNTTAVAGRPASGSSAGIIGGNAGWGQPGGAGAYGVATASGAQYTGVSGSTSLITKGVNGRTIIGVPAQTGTLTYTGYVQYPTWSSTANMSFGGTTSGIEAQTYTASVTPDSTHCWSGGSTVTKYINWTISEAVLPAATAQAKSQLEAIFDTAHASTTVKPVFTTGGELLGLQVILGKDYGPLTLPVDLGAVTLDLNGWMIKGENGAAGEGSTPGEDGGAAITVVGASGAAAGDTTIMVVNNTSGTGTRPTAGSNAGIVGGTGGMAGEGGRPGSGGLAIVDGTGEEYGEVTDSLGLVQRGAGGVLGAATVDPASDYMPTKAINGDLEEEPFMEFVQGGVHYTRENARYDRGSGTISAIYPNGVDGGWNTSENTRYGSSFFEWGGPNGWGARDGHGHFMEMNANNPAVFWQDLTTYGGDVILWSVRHGARYDFGYFDQCIRVEVGAPNGVATGLWENVNSNIKSDTKVIYTYDGVQNPEGDVTYGYAGELEGLLLHNCPGGWSTVTGVYLIPEGQDVTRFAFLSILPSDSGAGNLLDDLEFATLIGNLKAKANEDGSVTFTGYWGDADASKHLRVEFNGETYDLDMSGVLNKNFTVTIPYSLIGGATVIDVYHEDYPQAKRTVIVQHPNQYTIVAEGVTFKAWCTNEMHSVETGCEHAGEEHAVAIRLDAADMAYTGMTYAGATLTSEADEWQAAGLPEPTLVYAARGSAEFDATAPTAVGLYTVKAMIRDLSVTADFEITKATLTVTADDKSVSSGDDVPAYTATVTGMVGVDSAATAYSGVPAFACAYVKGSATGTYAITPSLGSLVSDNYDFVYVDGTLTVSDIRLDVDAVTIGDGAEWRTVTIDYTLENVNPAVDYEVVFTLTADGVTKAVTNAPAKLTTGAASKVIDTSTLFDLPGADRHAKVRVSLVAPVVFDEKEFDLAPDSWQVGDDAWAYLTDDGALCVFGTGVTWDFSSRKQAWPVMQVKRAAVGNLVTEIGNRFFKKCYNMKSIVCGSSVVRFRERAFYLCTSLVDIGVSNPGFEISCLQDSIIYQMAIDSATGKFFMVPSVEISGFTPALYGKRELTDAEWTRLGALANRNLNELKADGTYHFFQTRLE